MPSARPQNTLGWIGLQLAEQQRQREAAQQIQIDQERREQNARGAEMGMQMVQHAIDAEDKTYQRKLGLANLLQKAQLAEAGRNERQMKEQAFKTPERNAKVKNLESQVADREHDNQLADNRFNQLEMPKFQYQKDQDKVENAQRAYGLLSGRLNAVNAPNPITGVKPFQLGVDLLGPAPGADVASGPMSGITPTPPNAPDETDMTKKQREEALEKASTDAQSIKDLRAIVAALADPAQADPTDFGKTGSRFSIKGISPNTIGDLLETKGSARRTALGMKVNAPLNAFMRKYGASLTNTELGRALGEAGLQKALGGEFDLFATPLPVLQTSFADTLKRLEESAGRTSEELRTNKRKLPGAEGRREPPPQTVAAEAAVGAPDSPSERQRRLATAQGNPELKARLKEEKQKLVDQGLTPEQVGEELHKILRQLVP